MWRLYGNGYLKSNSKMIKGKQHWIRQMHNNMDEIGF